jgi:chain length determinant protein tyrosine kinase EpsG
MSGNEVVPAPAERTEQDADQRAIGALLVQAGKLAPQDVDAILQTQGSDGQRFGAAGMALGLLCQADVDYALSQQFDYTYLRPGESKVSQEVVAAYQPFGLQVEALRALRAELMLRWFDGDPQHKALAVVSEGAKEGRSYLAANLAVVFAQLGGRTLLIDSDLRNARQHALFGLDNRVGLSSILSGRAGPEAIQRIPSLENLSVLPAGALPPNPQELLTRPMFGHLLRQFGEHVDMILLDSPPAADSADAQTLAMRAGAALVVVRKDGSRMARVQHVAQSVKRARSTVVGAVLNEF